MQTQRKNDRIEKTQTITQNQAHNQELKFTASKLNKNVKDLVSSLRQEIYFQVQCLQIPLPVTLFIVMYKLNSTQRHSANNIYCSLVDMAHYQCSNFLPIWICINRISGSLTLTIETTACSLSCTRFIIEQAQFSVIFQSFQ